MKTIKEILKENPQCIEEEPILIGSFLDIDLISLKEDYKLVKKLNNKFSLYIETDFGGFIAGIKLNDIYRIVMMIAAHKINHIKFLDDSLQIKMVETTKGFEKQGLAKLVYSEIVQTNIDLVSDKIQYGMSKKLWKSLARSKEINVYIYNSKTKKYFTDLDDKIINYNGSNFKESLIWGSTKDFQEIVLVGTTKEILHN